MMRLGAWHASPCRQCCLPPGPLSLSPAAQGAGQDKDLMSWQIPLGRRWRSLKLFFVLRCYGAQKLRAYIRHHCALAAWFAQQVRLCADVLS